MGCEKAFSVNCTIINDLHAGAIVGNINLLATDQSGAIDTSQIVLRFEVGFHSISVGCSKLGKNLRLIFQVVKRINGMADHKKAGITAFVGCKNGIFMRIYLVIADVFHRPVAVERILISNLTVPVRNQKSICI